MYMLSITLHSRQVTSRQFEEIVKLSVVAMVGLLKFDIFIRSGYDEEVGETLEGWDWQDLNSYHNFERLQPTEQVELQDYIISIIHKEEKELS